MTNIQKIIKNAYLEALKEDLITHKNSNVTSTDDDTGEMLHLAQNFQSVFSTVVWFLEQDPFTNVAMHLDVNCWKVKQGNYTAENKKDEHFAIQDETGNTFQNTPIYLLFYERIKKSAISSEEMLLATKIPPEILSMSVCKLKKSNQVKVDNLAYEILL